jgi:hypothetical protein
MGIVVKIVDGRKRCTDCKEWKPLEDFSPCNAVKSKRHSDCKACAAKRMAERRRKNPERTRFIQQKSQAKRRERYAEDAEYRKSVKERSKKFWQSLSPYELRKRRWQNHLITAYGMTQKDFEFLVAKHDGCCHCCGKKRRKMCIDHDHETGKVRGLLCSNCNTAIGLMGDSVVTLQSAIDYLRSYRAGR